MYVIAVISSIPITNKLCDNYKNYGMIYDSIMIITYLNRRNVLSNITSFYNVAQFHGLGNCKYE
jgi:hypothetical protein